MAEVRVKGQGSRAEAARLGQDIAAGTAAALSGHAPRHIDTLRISLPAGAGKR